MLFAQTAILVTVFGVVLVLFSALLILVFVRTLAPWLLAQAAGLPISLLEVFRMRLRKVDANIVVRGLIMAGQAGLGVSCSEMERAYLEGADIEKVTLAAIKALKEDTAVTFQELVAAELEGRTADSDAHS